MNFGTSKIAKQESKMNQDVSIVDKKKIKYIIYIYYIYIIIVLRTGKSGSTMLKCQEKIDLFLKNVVKKPVN